MTLLQDNVRSPPSPTERTSKIFPIRKAARDISPIFVERWSPRAFSGEAIPDEVLLTAVEAARWAPSGFNLQPWRFIYSKNGSASWENFLSLLPDNNRVWAEKASALIVIASKTKLLWDGEEIAATTHSFDAGAAWSNFAHQARLLGWHTHAMGGFDRNKARINLNIADDLAVEVIVAIGRLGDRDNLPDKLQRREFPSGRLPLETFIIDGAFPASDATEQGQES